MNAALEQGGATVEVLHGADLDLGFPGEPATEDASRLEKAVSAADAVVLATPEYHGTYSAFTKLVIENLGYPSALDGKPVAMLGVAGGRLGATKSLEHLRNTCAHTGAIVLPSAISVANARSVFSDEGQCVDATAKQSLEGLAESVLEFLHHYVAPREVLSKMIDEGHQVPWTPTRE